MHYVFHAMGIPVHITIVGEETDEHTRCAKNAEKIFHSWDEEFSRFLEGSALVKLNAGAGAWQNVSPRMFSILQKCVRIAKETNGVFDPSVGGHLAHYGYGLPKNYELPSPFPTYRDIVFDEATSRVLCAKGQVLEPAAIVKGLAIDAAGGTLPKDAGWMLNAGGDILTHGDFPPQSHWNVAIQHPKEKSAAVTVVKIHNEALATSGTYEVGGVSGSAPWHHQVDMQTGNPTAGVASVSIIAPTAERADTLASIAILLGLSQGKVFLDKEGVPYLFVTEEDRMYKNSAFSARETKEGLV